MQILKSILVLVLALLFLPVSSHCRLELLAGMEWLACYAHEDAAPHQDDYCETDACAVVEGGS